MVILMFDGMHMQPQLDYSRPSDDIFGHEDIGPQKTSTKQSENVLLFMIRSLFGGWTERIGHHYTPPSFSKDQIKLCIFDYLAALANVNLICAAVVCDQAAAHVSLFTGLGVTKDTPYIKCPYTDRKVYVIYDPPHLLKSTRNNLLNYDFKVILIFIMSLKLLQDKFISVNIRIS